MGGRDPVLQGSRLRCPVLADEQADKIRRELEAGVREPVLLKRIRELLDARDERLGRSPPDVQHLPLDEDGRETSGMEAG